MPSDISHISVIFQVPDLANHSDTTLVPLFTYYTPACTGIIYIALKSHTLVIPPDSANHSDTLSN